MAVGTRMQQRRALAADWATSNYVLAAGEIGVTTDTNIIKVGNGVSHWNDLPPVFDSQYLPILGTAANSALLGGVSVNSLVKIADTDANPTNNTYVKRTADGGIKATDATENTEVTTLQQVTAALAVNKQEPVVRTVTASTTVALTDIGKMIFVDNSSLTTQVTVQIPKNATTAFPIGSWFDISASNNGGAKIIAVPADVAIVGLYGKLNVMPPNGIIRLFKIGIDQWLGTEHKQGRLPKICVYRATGGAAYNSAYIPVPYDGVDANDTYNPDNEWFSLPAAGLSVGRRVIINKPGEYLLDAHYSNSGAPATTWMRLTKMLADNSLTNAVIVGISPVMVVGSCTARIRAIAGDSYGVVHGFGSGITDAADGRATGGNPNYFTITRIGD